MKSLKKHIVILATAALMVAGTVVPAMAQDTTSPAPVSENTITITVNLGDFGPVTLLSIPVRCGNSC
ncbi:MAG: hypothetical protein LCI00_28980 [Chloroflexi bacterium]|nr:hypothetical protein [Chloroflexota bacterium]MCC6896764.1 hypothetical protein [Anaerolineae bacterium]